MLIDHISLLLSWCPDRPGDFDRPVSGTNESGASIYISQLESIPLLIGKDLLNQFELLLDLQCLKIWTQVRESLPLITPTAPSMKCHTLATTFSSERNPKRPLPHSLDGQS